jgi:hypothetical protein
MTTVDPAHQQTLRQHLDALTAQLPPGDVPVGHIVATLGRDGLLIFSVFLCLPFLLPVQIPGVSTVFGLLILFIGVAIMIDRDVWLPAKLKVRMLPRDKLRSILDKGAHWLARVERISRPRLQSITDGQLMTRVNGAQIVLGAILLMLPLAIIPFSNTLPALAIMFLAVGVVQRDGGCILLGALFNVLSIAYFSAIAVLGVATVLKLFQSVPGLASLVG